MQKKELNALVAEVPAGESNAERRNRIERKVQAAITYGIGRHDWYEVQRSKIFTATMGLLTAVIALIAITTRISETAQSFHQNVVLVASLIGAFVTVGRVLYLYNKELDADRPYRLVSDIRFWFFRYNLPGSGKYSLKLADPSELAVGVERERTKFFNKVVENLGVRESLREDLEQLFILQVLQRYKSESLAKLRWAFSYLYGFLLVQVFLFVFVAVFLSR